MKKICRKCKIEKDLRDFYKQKRGKFGVRGKCIECITTVAQEFYKNNRDSELHRVRVYGIKHKEERQTYYQRTKIYQIDKEMKRRKVLGSIYLEERKIYLKDYRRKLRKDFISMYGGVCTCCGESNFKFLSIEHLLGQVGKKKDGSARAYAKALKFYQPDIYTVLCFNCNMGKSLNRGVCPHQEAYQ